jgi:hypothetical protein
MDQRRFASQIYGEVVLDLCWDCDAIWFDRYESSQLSPGAVIELFRLIHEHRDALMRTLADSMNCPRCRAKLVLTHDMQRTNRLTYYRCPDSHGRLTTFFQFLREKEFIRSLSQPEIERLKATVSQVRCSSCGAPVDVARDAACSFCRAPLSILDAAAVEKTLAALSQADQKRAGASAADFSAAFDSLLARQPRAADESPWTRHVSSNPSMPAIVDLVVDGIGWLLEP